MENKYGTVLTAEVFGALVKNFTEPKEEEVVAARWQSLDGVEYFGLDINPDRPSVVFGFVELPREMGGGLEFSTFWVVEEEDNPYSYGRALSDEFIEILFDGRPIKLGRWQLDTTWVPIPLDELMKQRGW